MLDGETLPHHILSHLHPTGAVGGAIRQRSVVAFEEGADVVSGALAVVHGHDDGRAAEGSVAGGKDHRVGGAHGAEVGAHPVGQHHVQGVELLADPLLPDGGDHHAALDLVLAAGHRERLSPTVLPRFPEGGGDTAQAEAPLCSGFDSDRLGVVDELDALLQGPIELDTPSRYLLRAAAVDDSDLFAAGKAPGDPTRVHGHIPATDDDDGFGKRRALSGVDSAQETHPVHDLRVVLARDVHGLAPPGPYGEQNGVVTLFELVERNVPAQCSLEMDPQPFALVGQSLDVLVDHPTGQAEGGNPPRHQATQAIAHLIHVDGVAGDAQIVGGGEACRSGTHDADRLGTRDRYWRRVAAVTDLVHDEALEVADLQRAVAVGAAAGRLAGSVADASADGAEGVGGGDGLKGFGVLPLPDQGDVGGSIRAHRTGDLTGGGHKVRVPRVVAGAGGRVGHLDALKVVDAHVTFTRGQVSRRDRRSGS